MYSFLFAILLLLSSGLVQFVVHVCPENGAVLSAESCHSHTQSHRNACCQETTETTDDGCCNDQFVFAVSAKFGGIVALELEQPNYALVAKSELNLHSQIPDANLACVATKHHSPPANSGKKVLQASQKLTI